MPEFYAAGPERDLNYPKILEQKLPTLPGKVPRLWKTILYMTLAWTNQYWTYQKPYDENTLKFRLYLKLPNIWLRTISVERSKNDLRNSLSELHGFGMEESRDQEEIPRYPRLDLLCPEYRSGTSGDFSFILISSFRHFKFVQLAKGFKKVVFMTLKRNCVWPDREKLRTYAKLWSIFGVNSGVNSRA